MKLKLTGLLLIMLFNLRSQTNKSNLNPNSISSSFNLNQKNVTSNDTLFINPNHFDSIAVIQFTIANNDTIWLDIYNFIGVSIKSFYKATVLPSGSYSVTLNGDSIPDGIYFVSLKINSTKTLTEKLIKVANAVELKENSLLKNILIYPNPTTSILNIVDDNNQLQNATIKINNSLGQVVFSSTFVPQINMSELSYGMYFLILMNKEITRTIKIIKQ
ncbi:MAG: T9SS type A sorting domain-containing protein [Bacteroidia bacterium]|nr:T9SS type A sorting domain-containing protein [Bacteroidia bacterium]